MYALQRQIADLSKRLKDERRGHTNHHVRLARQNEAKREQPPQSEANVCRHKCNLERASLIICTEYPTQTRGCVLVPRTR